MSEELRLQKIIADRGYCSRRHAEELILNGQVKVNGIVINELGKKFSADSEITVNGKPIYKVEEKYYFAFNIPLRVVTTLKDDRGRKTISDYIPKKYGRLFPIGRLDYNTSGLIILTNDGYFANKVMHPSSEIEKTYEAVIEGDLTLEDEKKLEEGIKLDDFVASPAKVIYKKNLSNKRTVFHIVIHEGKNREVRRMMEALDKSLISLKRIAIGNYKLENLKIGELKRLTISEIEDILFKEN